jgi:hypothetical protein
VFTGAAGVTTGAAGASTGAGGVFTGAAGVTTGAAGATGAGGTTGTAGTTGGAGSGACSVTCPALLCKPGFMPVLDTSVSCCPVCRPLNCATVDCAQPRCDANSHLETPTGQCCPICAPGPDPACAKGQQSYASLRKSLVEKYQSAGCMTDADCTLVFENNACAASCGIAVSGALAMNLISNLDSAAQSCATCPPPPLPPCARFVALCSNGQCVAGAPPAN